MMQQQQEQPAHSDVQPLIAMLEATGNKYDFDKIRRAFALAARLHAGQFRISGEPYITHPVAVAEILAGYGLDTDSICSALLHDVVEDCPDQVSLDELRKDFGEDVALIVDGLTKIVPFDVTEKEEAHLETIRKMLLATSKDIRVIIVKLCDRLHNMRTLAVKREAKQRATALETMQVYAPLAHRLGMQKIKHELENLSLRYLDPPGFQEIEEGVTRHYGEHNDLIDNACREIEAKLEESDIHCHTEGRIKSIYSVYKKTINQNKGLDEIFDFYALRVIVETELECYTALGIVHEMYKSVPGRFKDYISTPKPNGYQSIHTTVIGREGVPFEVQIRTQTMHEVANYGIAAHWKYKRGGGIKQAAQTDQKLEWISRLLEETETTDSEELIRALKVDIYQEEVYVFTPKGDLITLPQGSTMIDFAYAIHSAVGNRMVGAKINGKIVQIDKSPQNGTVVEIITSQSSKGPSRDWLSIVKTSEARNKIRQWFKKERRSENIELGISMIEGEIRKYGRAVTVSMRDEIVSAVADRIGMKSRDDLYNTLGYGGLALSKIQPKLRDECEKRAKPLEEEPSTDANQIIRQAQQTQQTKKRRVSKDGVIIDGDVDCQVKFSRCCNPLHGDPIIGFITKGYGISIHRQDCASMKANAKDGKEDRFVRAEWDSSAKGEERAYESVMVIHAEQASDLLTHIINVLIDMRVPWDRMKTQNNPKNGTMTVTLTVICKNVGHYASIESRIKGLKHVDSVRRGSHK